ncbi:MAG: putative toxin-antitoxin system toxin component, PIN family [Nitrospiraceae bacterium]|nr:putative toxin-antitoxin system toxin component, PIN family [Nitrospirota bacterium]MDA8337793.1 putative toxin-antitoxin system toxin component, PIN family [Nitrospiraceae bacterium]
MLRKKGVETVLIDTNVWVSAFINPSGYPAKVLELWLQNKIRIVVAPLLLEEIADVLKRQRLQKKYGYKNSEIEKYLTLIATGAKMVIVSGSINLCRDSKDNHILEAAIKGRVKYLITRDDDIKGDSELVVQLAKQNVTVITVSNFLKLHVN